LVIGNAGDDQDFRTDWEIEESPTEEIRSNVVIAGMSNNIPEDLFRKFAQSSCGTSPMCDGHIDDHVTAERLPLLVAALRSHGYTVVEDT
jgi:hypothetical protein